MKSYVSIKATLCTFETTNPATMDLKPLVQHKKNELKINLEWFGNLEYKREFPTKHGRRYPAGIDFLLNSHQEEVVGCAGEE